MILSRCCFTSFRAILPTRVNLPARAILPAIAISLSVTLSISAALVLSPQPTLADHHEMEGVQEMKVSEDEMMEESSFGDDIISCQEIFETSSYRKRENFTRYPTKFGCHVGQLFGGIVGVPFALIYAPACAATDRGGCDRAKTPIEDGSELFGRIIGYTVGAPFFLLETIFYGGDEDVE